MNEDERKIVKKFERLYLKDFNNEKITNEDRLSYIECALITNLIEKLQKENEKLEETNNELEAEKNEAIRRYNFETIPIQKIKDKIEELYQQDKNWSEEMSEPDSNFKNIDRNLKRIKNQIDVLQELIEESEEK